MCNAYIKKYGIKKGDFYTISAFNDFLLRKAEVNVIVAIQPTIRKPPLID